MVLSISNAMSNSESVNFGVPQGSSLGLLVVLIFINDLGSSVSSTESYADDTTIYDIQSDNLYKS